MLLQLLVISRIFQQSLGNCQVIVFLNEAYALSKEAITLQSENLEIGKYFKLKNFKILQNFIRISEISELHHYREGTIKEC